MKINLNKKLLIWFFLMFALGMTGSILFFPININSRYTCLYHRIFQSRNEQVAFMSQPLERGMLEVKESNGNSKSSDIEKNNKIIISDRDDVISRSTPAADPDEGYFCANELLKNYIHGYALFWWGSLLLLAGGYFLMKNRKPVQNPGPNQR